MEELDILIDALMDLKLNMDKRNAITCEQVWAIHKDSKYSKPSLKKQFKEVNKKFNELVR